VVTLGFEVFLESHLSPGAGWPVRTRSIQEATRHGTYPLHCDAVGIKQRDSGQLQTKRGGGYIDAIGSELRYARMIRTTIEEGACTAN
jgi:hypothetical protein